MECMQGKRGGDRGGNAPIRRQETTGAEVRRGAGCASVPNAPVKAVFSTPLPWCSLPNVSTVFPLYHCYTIVRDGSHQAVLAHSTAEMLPTLILQVTLSIVSSITTLQANHVKGNKEKDAVTNVEVRSRTFTYVACGSERAHVLYSSGGASPS